MSDKPVRDAGMRNQLVRAVVGARPVAGQSRNVLPVVRHDGSEQRNIVRGNRAIKVDDDTPLFSILHLMQMFHVSSWTRDEFTIDGALRARQLS